MHPSGLPAGDGSRRCGACAWAHPDDGVLRCLAAAVRGEGGPVVGAAEPGCAWWEAPVDCATCGACCREAFDAVPVEPDDRALLARHADLVHTWDDGWRSVRRVPSPTGCGTRCAALTGDGRDAPFRCTIYGDRPTACRELEANAPNCLLARRRIGLSPGEPW